MGRCLRTWRRWRKMANIIPDTEELEMECILSGDIKCHALNGHIAAVQHHGIYPLITRSNHGTSRSAHASPPAQQFVALINACFKTKQYKVDEREQKLDKRQHSDEGASPQPLPNAWNTRGTGEPEASGLVHDSIFLFALK